MKKLDAMSIMVVAFITVLLGIILAGSLANEVQRTAAINTITNETVAITNATRWVQQELDFDDVVSGSEAIVWANNSVVGDGFYDIVYATGLINFTDNETYYVTYQYHHDDYVHNSTSRTLVGLVTLFFVIGVVIFAYGLFRKLFPDM